MRYHLLFLRELVEDIKAFFREEKRVTSRGTTGRVYAAKVKGSLTKVRVFRKNTGKWETTYTKG